jgi:hypothetical protein
MTKLWSNEHSGAITCDNHAGAYLTGAKAQRPKAKSHNTPLGKWAIMSDEDVTIMTEAYGVLCDGCRR